MCWRKLRADGWQTGTIANFTGGPQESAGTFGDLPTENESLRLDEPEAAPPDQDASETANVPDNRALLNADKSLQDEIILEAGGVVASKVVDAGLYAAKGVYGTLGEVVPAEVGMFRRAANQGAFSDLPVTMDLKTVRSYATEAGVGLDGIKVRIIRDESLLDSGFTGYAHPNGKMIDLYPQAFSSPEDLIRTLGHERMHAYQAQTFGAPQGSVDLMLNEKAAYGLEDSFVQYWRSQGGH